MKEILLTQGYVTLVDDDDYYWLSQWNWSVNIRTGGKTIYADRAGRRKSSDGRNLGPKRRISMHRVIMRIVENEDFNTVVDHIDGNGLNNQKSNLRICSRAENNANRQPVEGMSKYKGVYWNKHNQAWTSEIRKGNYRKYLGLFLTEEEAAKAYDVHAFELNGEYAKQNFPGINKSNYIIRSLDRRSERRKPVIDTLTGEFYESATAAWESSGITRAVFFSKLKGDTINDTNYRYL